MFLNICMKSDALPGEIKFEFLFVKLDILLDFFEQLEVSNIKLFDIDEWLLESDLDVLLLRLDSSRQLFGFSLVEDNNVINRGHSTGLSLLLDETRELSSNSLQIEMFIMSQIKDNGKLFGSSNCLVLVSLVELLLDLDGEVLVEPAGFSLDDDLSSFLQGLDLLRSQFKLLLLE